MRDRRRRVVRVRLTTRGRLYAYRVPEPVRVGRWVEVDTPLSGTVRCRVQKLGRGLYFGRLKKARLI